MINEVYLKNFGPIHDVRWQNLSNINVVIGENGVGKTFVLKAMYSAYRALHQYKRGNDNQPLRDKLLERIKWTFEVNRIGDLVRRGGDGNLVFSISVDKKTLDYNFGSDTEKQIREIENHVERPEPNAIFIPAKEVLSIQDIVIGLRDLESLFGFDDTYVDLCRALKLPTRSGKFSKEIKQARENLDKIIGGRIFYDDVSGQWMFRRNRHNFSIREAAEGVRKIAILETLLGSRYLEKNSIVFIDEPESALHPTAIIKFLDIVSSLASFGVQFFISTHSYFVLKKLLLISRAEGTSVPVLSLVRGNDGEAESYVVSDLADGLPKNPIIDASIDLYRAEVESIFE